MARRNRDLVQILDEHERAIRRLRQSLARAGGGGVTDHGALTGLGDVADHPGYVLVDGTRDITGPQSILHDNGSDPQLILEGGYTGNYWVGNVKFTNNEDTKHWQVGSRGASDADLQHGFLIEYYDGSAYLEALRITTAGVTTFANDVWIDAPAGKTGGYGLWIWNEHASGYGVIELGGKLGAYMDFKNAKADDQDVRLRLYSNDDFRFEGANWTFGGHIYPYADNAVDLGSTALGWNQVYMAAGGGFYLGGGTTSWMGHDGSNMIFYNDTGGHVYIDARVDNSDVTLRATSGSTLRSRIWVDGNQYIKFYNKSGVQKFQVDDGGILFNDEIFGTSAMTSTGSTSYNEIVHNASTYQFYRFTSRRDVKKNIKDMDPALSEGIYDLQLRTFDMRKANQTGDVWADFGQHGMIADEVHKVYGDIAAPPSEDGKPSGWSNKFMVVMLLSEAQKAKRESIAQDARISSLEAALHRLNKHRH